MILNAFIKITHTHNFLYMKLKLDRLLGPKLFYSPEKPRLLYSFVIILNKMKLKIGFSTNTTNIMASH